MEVIILLLIVAYFVILHIPTEELVIIKETCERHEWVTKPSGIEDNNYLVCSMCGYLPECDGYEEKERQ